ncbi:MAG: hypothetical protein JRJ68_09285 [Deltaproteobacteria bacterium]|nr:hypothetical protein [Deltaproteobacteria bacterium]
MAPARMVAFIEEHAERCEICLQDPDLKGEIAKITEIVLPESKIPKAIRQKTEKAVQEEENTAKAKNDAIENEDDTKTEEDDKDVDSEKDTPLVNPSNI